MDKGQIETEEAKQSIRDESKRRRLSMASQSAADKLLIQRLIRGDLVNDANPPTVEVEEKAPTTSLGSLLSSMKKREAELEAEESSSEDEEQSFAVQKEFKKRVAETARKSEKARDMAERALSRLQTISDFLNLTKVQPKLQRTREISLEPLDLEEEMGRIQRTRDNGLRASEFFSSNLAEVKAMTDESEAVATDAALDEEERALIEYQRERLERMNLKMSTCNCHQHLEEGLELARQEGLNLSRAQCTDAFAKVIVGAVGLVRGMEAALDEKDHKIRDLTVQLQMMTSKVDSTRNYIYNIKDRVNTGRVGTVIEGVSELDFLDRERRLLRSLKRMSGKPDEKDVQAVLKSEFKDGYLEHELTADAHWVYRVMRRARHIRDINFKNQLLEQKLMAFCDPIEISNRVTRRSIEVQTEDLEHNAVHIVHRFNDGDTKEVKNVLEANIEDAIATRDLIVTDEMVRAGWDDAGAHSCVRQPIERLLRRIKDTLVVMDSVRVASLEEVAPAVSANEDLMRALTAHVTSGQNQVRQEFTGLIEYMRGSLKSIRYEVTRAASQCADEASQRVMAKLQEQLITPGLSEIMEEDGTGSPRRMSSKKMRELRKKSLRKQSVLSKPFLTPQEGGLEFDAVSEVADLGPHPVLKIDVTETDELSSNGGSAFEESDSEEQPLSPSMGSKRKLNARASLQPSKTPSHKRKSKTPMSMSASGMSGSDMVVPSDIVTDQSVQALETLVESMVSFCYERFDQTLLAPAQGILVRTDRVNEATRQLSLCLQVMDECMSYTPAGRPVQNSMQTDDDGRVSPRHVDEMRDNVKKMADEWAVITRTLHEKVHVDIQEGVRSRMCLGSQRIGRLKDVEDVTAMMGTFCRWCSQMDAALSVLPDKVDPVEMAEKAIQATAPAPLVPKLSSMRVAPADGAMSPKSSQSNMASPKRSMRSMRRTGSNVQSISQDSPLSATTGSGGRTRASFADLNVPTYQSAENTPGSTSISPRVASGRDLNSRSDGSPLVDLDLKQYSQPDSFTMAKSPRHGTLLPSQAAAQGGGPSVVLTPPRADLDVEALQRKLSTVEDELQRRQSELMDMKILNQLQQDKRTAEATAKQESSKLRAEETVRIMDTATAVRDALACVVSLNSKETGELLSDLNSYEARHDSTKVFDVLDRVLGWCNRVKTLASQGVFIVESTTNERPLSTSSSNNPSSVPSNTPSNTPPTPSVAPDATPAAADSPLASPRSPRSSRSKQKSARTEDFKPLWDSLTDFCSSIAKALSFDAGVDAMVVPTAAADIQAFVLDFGRRTLPYVDKAVAELASSCQRNASLQESLDAEKAAVRELEGELAVQAQSHRDATSKLVKDKQEATAMCASLMEQRADGKPVDMEATQRPDPKQPTPASSTASPLTTPPSTPPSAQQLNTAAALDYQAAMDTLKQELASQVAQVDELRHELLLSRKEMAVLSQDKSEFQQEVDRLTELLPRSLSPRSRLASPGAASITTPPPLGVSIATPPARSPLLSPTRSPPRTPSNKATTTPKLASRVPTPQSVSRVTMQLDPPDRVASPKSTSPRLGTPAAFVLAKTVTVATQTELEKPSTAVAQVAPPVSMSTCLQQTDTIDAFSAARDYLSLLNEREQSNITHSLVGTAVLQVHKQLMELVAHMKKRFSLVSLTIVDPVSRLQRGDSPEVHSLLQCDSDLIASINRLLFDDSVAAVNRMKTAFQTAKTNVIRKRIRHFRAELEGKRRDPKVVAFLDRQDRKLEEQQAWLEDQRRKIKAQRERNFRSFVAPRMQVLALRPVFMFFEADTSHGGPLTDPNEKYRQDLLVKMRKWCEATRKVQKPTSFGSSPRFGSVEPEEMMTPARVHSLLLKHQAASLSFGSPGAHRNASKTRAHASTPQQSSRNRTFFSSSLSTGSREVRRSIVPALEAQPLFPMTPTPTPAPAPADAADAARRQAKTPSSSHLPPTRSGGIRLPRV